jgi:hypothetical protein
MAAEPHVREIGRDAVAAAAEERVEEECGDAASLFAC